MLLKAEQIGVPFLALPDCVSRVTSVVQAFVVISKPGTLGYLPRCSAHRATPARPQGGGWWSDL